MKLIGEGAFRPTEDRQGQPMKFAFHNAGGRLRHVFGFQELSRKSMSHPEKLNLAVGVTVTTLPQHHHLPLYLTLTTRDVSALDE